MGILAEARDEFKRIVRERGIEADSVEITAEGLSPEESIGDPGRRDFPLLQGREVMIEAVFKGSRGQAFTDQPGEYRGTLAEIIEMEMKSSRERALLVAAINAVLRHLDLIERTVHCRDDEMEKCMEEMVMHITEKRDDVEKVGIVGFQPALVEKAVNSFGVSAVMVTDLDGERIGSEEYGVKILDGDKDTEYMVKSSDFLFITGSTAVNSTADYLLELLEAYGREFTFYGNTISGVSWLLDLPQLCFYGRKG